MVARVQVGLGIALPEALLEEARATRVEGGRDGHLLARGESGVETLRERLRRGNRCGHSIQQVQPMWHGQEATRVQHTSTSQTVWAAWAGLKPRKCALAAASSANPRQQTIDKCGSARWISRAIRSDSQALSRRPCNSGALAGAMRRMMLRGG